MKIIIAIIRILFYIILSPLFLIWLFIKRKRYLYAFSRELKKSGMDKSTIKYLIKHMVKFNDLVEIGQKINQELYQ